jgi:hypothetical protein
VEIAANWVLPTPLSSCSHLDVFTFEKSIAVPIRILQQLGIHIFTNLQFETMVLRTIWTHLVNNKAGSPDARRRFVDEITPHLPLFNHSCEPNVQWRRDDGSSTIHFYFERDIRKEEELFSSYVYTEIMDFEQRTEALWPWFEGPCLCKKCERDRGSIGGVV